jgi:hypothetical protein
MPTWAPDLHFRGLASAMPYILVTMAGNLFDVFVVGATDPSAAGETRLAAGLSAKHGVPLATVAKAISAKNLRAGQGLEQAQAQALVRHLQSIGAVTVIRPAGARAQGHAPAPSVQAAHTAASGPPLGPAMGRTSAPMASVGGGWPGGPAQTQGDPVARAHFAAAGGSGAGQPQAGSGLSADPFGPLSPSPQAVSVQAGAPDPFQPGRAISAAPGIANRPRQTGTQPTPAPVRPSVSGLAIDVAPGPKLELARNDRGASEEDMSTARSRSGGSAASLREMGMTGNSGVAMDEDPKNLNLVRCVQHGLYYDKTKASGCRKCMSPAREVAIKMTADTTVFRMGNLHNKPAKRAFLGMLFAVVLGFLPAAYYCFGPGAAEVRKLRVEQELLGRQPGTEEIIKRFDQLDGQVGDLHEQATRNTAIVWVAVASVSMLGWYKIT